MILLTKTKKKSKAKNKKEDKSEECKKEVQEHDKLFQRELEKLGKEADDIFIETETNVDNFKQYPELIVCKHDPMPYLYPMMMKLEHHNIVRLLCMNKYTSTILRLSEIINWGVDIRLRRKKIVIQRGSTRKLIVNEFILEKIPACRR